MNDIERLKELEQGLKQYVDAGWDVLEVDTVFTKQVDPVDKMVDPIMAAHNELLGRMDKKDVSDVLEEVWG